VARAWDEAIAAKDPTALKCEKELMDSIASREQWSASEWGEMQGKWYVVNRGELKSRFWRSLV
jgi:hypothetical protein